MSSSTADQAAADAAASSPSPSQSILIPQPYRWWYHPHKSWIDIILSTVMPYLLSFDSIVACDPTPSPETLAVCRAFRDKYQKQEDTMCKAHLKSWADLVRGPIVETLISVPRRPLLLSDECCRLTKPNDPILKASSPAGDVPVRLYFPASLLPVSVPVPDDDNDIGAKAVQLDDPLRFLRELPSDVPVVLCFHSGGLNIGSARDQTLLHLLHNVSAIFDGKPLVAVSVEYGLVPDRPFPAAPIDALSVVTHFLDGLKDDPDRKVHLAGASSGAYLALVTALELVRIPKYAPRLASVLAAAPMLDPKADADTYYLNAPSSMIDVRWFRWCWQAYLGLKPGRVDNVSNEEAPATFEEACRRNSNRTAYAESKWTGHAVERLIRPAVDVPAIASLAPDLRWVVVTNSADPLEREGLDFLGKLRDAAGSEAACVTHLSHRGSHWFGTRVDRAAYAEMLETWGRLIYGVEVEVDTAGNVAEG